MKRAWVLAAGIACTALVGCGSPKPAISASASSTLMQQVAAVRAAAANDDVVGARAGVSQLSRTVTELQDSGQISADRAAGILAAAAEVDAQLDMETTTEPTTLPTPASLPTPPTMPAKNPPPGPHDLLGKDKKPGPG